MFFDILITLFLVALNGFFVAAEFAIVKVRASTIELKAKEGNRLAIIARNMVANLDAYLSATQLGITLASLGLGWIGEGVVSSIIINAMHGLGLDMEEETAHQIALPIAFALITVLHIVFGELAPKSLAIQRPESTALATAPLLRLFYIVFLPFIWVLNGFSNFMLRLIGIHPGHGHEVHSPQELLYIMEESKESGSLRAAEHAMLENVFEFYDRSAKQIMVHRTMIDAVDLEWGREEAIAYMIKQQHTRYPVFVESLDRIVGIIHTRDVLESLHRDDEKSLNDLLREAYFVPEAKTIGTLLRDFQQRHNHMAIVVDEFGGTSGLVTLEDILEEVVGEIQDEYDTEVPWVEKISEKEYIIQASANIIDANEQLPYPIPESEDYDTVGGYVITMFGRLPDVNEKINASSYQFTVLSKVENHLERVQAVVIREPLEEETD